MIEMEREGKGRISTSTGMLSSGSSRNKYKIAPAQETEVLTGLNLYPCTSVFNGHQ